MAPRAAAPFQKREIRERKSKLSEHTRVAVARRGARRGRRGARGAYIGYGAGAPARARGHG
eukprot:scaffold114885_cov63-Phaeocystis_antarctica.AAC.7